MLSDRERRTLLEIQHGLTIQDPNFARSFHAIEQRHRRHCFSWWMYTSAIVFAVLMSGLMLLAGLILGSLLFAAATWGITTARRAHTTSVPRKEAARCLPDPPRPDLESAPTTRPPTGSASDRDEQAPIVVGVDGSAAGQQALAWAAAEAAARRRPLRIVHAVDPAPASAPTAPHLTVPTGPEIDMPRKPRLDVQLDSKTRSAGEDLLEESETATWHAAPDVAIDTRLVVAAAPQALLAQAQDAELLVLGHRSRRGLTGLFLGSVGIEVATAPPCPVVIVGSRAAHRAGPSAGRIVVGVDDGESSLSVVEFAFQTAARRGVGVTGVHAWTPAIASYAGCDLAPVLAELRAAEEQRLRLLIDAFARERRNAPDVNVELKIVRTNPAHALAAESAGAELVVIGSRKRGHVPGMHLGSVSRGVLHRADCPVAVVPTKSQPSRT